MHNTWPLSSLYDKHLSRCPCICPSLSVSVQINVKVQNTDITARPTGLEETRVPVHISQCLSLPKNGFGGYVCCNFLWHMGLMRLKLIRTSGPSNEHNEGKPAKTANWLPQAALGPAAAGRQGRTGPCDRREQGERGSELRQPSCLSLLTSPVCASLAAEARGAQCLHLAAYHRRPPPTSCGLSLCLPWLCSVLSSQSTH